MHELLAKWRHFAYAELKDPGSYFRLLATGQAPAGSISGDGMKALIRQRLGR